MQFHFSCFVLFFHFMRKIGRLNSFHSLMAAENCGICSFVAQALPYDYAIFWLVLLLFAINSAQNAYKLNSIFTFKVYNDQFIQGMTWRQHLTFVCKRITAFWLPGCSLQLIYLILHSQRSPSIIFIYLFIFSNFNLYLYSTS